MEHALVFASIIVGVAVTDEVMSLHRLLRARSRVRWDWAALAVAALVLLTVVQVWWAAARPAAPAITIGQFLPLMVELILLVLLSAAVLPDEVPTDGLDLAVYYDANGSYIWSLFSAAFGWVIVSGDVAHVAAGGALLPLLAQQAAEVGILGVMVSLIFVRRRRWHLVALALLSLGPIGWLSRSLA